MQSTFLFIWNNHTCYTMMHDMIELLKAFYSGLHVYLWCTSQSVLFSLVTILNDFMYNFVVVNLYRSHIANLFGSTLCKHIINANSEKDGRFVELKLTKMANCHSAWDLRDITRLLLSVSLYIWYSCRFIIRKKNTFDYFRLCSWGLLLELQRPLILVGCYQP